MYLSAASTRLQSLSLSVCCYSTTNAAFVNLTNPGSNIFLLVISV